MTDTPDRYEATILTEYQLCTIPPVLLARCDEWARAIEPLLVEQSGRTWVRMRNDGEVIRVGDPLWVYFYSLNEDPPGTAWTVKIPVPQEGYEYAWDTIASAEVAAAVSDLRHAGMP